jgi:hypothetical protein
VGSLEGVILDIIKKVLGPFRRSLQQTNKHLPFPSGFEGQDLGEGLIRTTITSLREARAPSDSRDYHIGAGIVTIASFELEAGLRAMRASQLQIEDDEKEPGRVSVAIG